MLNDSKLGLAGVAVGDDVADVFHAGGKEDKALKAEAESGVGNAAVFPQLEMPPIVFAL